MHRKHCDKTEQKGALQQPLRYTMRQKRVKVQFSSVCRKKSQIHSKAGSSGFAWILSQMCSFLRGSKLSSSLTQFHELEVGLSHPEGQMINSLHTTDSDCRLNGRSFPKPDHKASTSLDEMLYAECKTSKCKECEKQKQKIVLTSFLP